MSVRKSSVKFHSWWRFVVATTSFGAAGTYFGKSEAPFLGFWAASSGHAPREFKGLRVRERALRRYRLSDGPSRRPRPGGPPADRESGFRRDPHENRGPGWSATLVDGPSFPQNSDPRRRLGGPRDALHGDGAKPRTALGRTAASSRRRRVSAPPPHVARGAFAATCGSAVASPASGFHRGLRAPPAFARRDRRVPGHLGPGGERASREDRGPRGAHGIPRRRAAIRRGFPRVPRDEGK